MGKQRRHKSTLARSEKLKAITALHYEPGNQARCYKAVWRRWIYPDFGICYRTYLNALGLDPESPPPKSSTPSLFDFEDL